MDRLSIRILSRTHARSTVLTLGVSAAITLGACSGAASPTSEAPSVAPSTGASTPQVSLLSSAPSATAAASSGAAIGTGAVLGVSTQANGTKNLTGADGGLLYAYHVGSPSGPTAFAPTSAAGYPPLLVPAGTVPVVGPGVIASKVGTAPIPGGGGTIVTYGGAPLYSCPAPTVSPYCLNFLFEPVAP